MRPVVLAICLATAAVCAASAGEPPPLAQVGPQSGSDAARSARPTGPEDALVFQLRSEEKGSAEKADTSTVTLTATYAATTTGATHELDDRTLCRHFGWTDAGGQVTSLSCYASPISRMNELQNRRVIGAMLKAAKIDKTQSLTNEYWAQAALGVTAGDETPLTVSTQQTTTEYRLGNVTVARTSGAAATLDADERARFARFVALHLPLHPQVRRALAASPTLPDRIEVQTAEVGEIKWRVYSISAVRRIRANYPLPAGLASSWRSPRGDADFAAGIGRALEAADARTHPPSFEALVARLQDAGTHGRGLEAVLAFFNLALQYPDQVGGANARAFGDRIRPAFTAALQDPQAARFLQLSSTAASADAQGRQAAARWLADQKTMDAVPFGSFRYVTFANLVSGANDADKWDASLFKAMPSPLTANYWRTIAAYPWASGFYKDCGALYLADFEPAEAWLAFDLGRAVDPEWKAGPMAAVAAMEQRIRTDQPDFF